MTDDRRVEEVLVLLLGRWLVGIEVGVGITGTHRLVVHPNATRFRRYRLRDH